MGYIYGIIENGIIRVVNEWDNEWLMMNEYQWDKHMVR